jgi:hypothetical protein
VGAVAANQIGTAGAKALATALESNHTLTTLDLYGAESTAVVVVCVWLRVLGEW